MKIGIFGGTFDPPHIGHLIVAQDAAELLSLDRVVFVPASKPPHKRDRAVTAASLRLEMLQLALTGSACFAIDTLELEREGPSYTVDTVRHLRQARPGDQFTLLVGMDQYREMDTWRDPAGIRENARIAALTRAGETDRAAFAGVAGASRDGDQGRDVCVAVTRIDISSTELRQRVSAGRPIRHMVLPAVESFIYNHQLYAETAFR